MKQDKGSGQVTAEPIEPMQQLLFFSLLDELFIKISKQRQEEQQDYAFVNFASSNNSRISCYLTFNNNILFLSLPEDYSVQDEQIKQFFFQLHKIYTVELMNTFYRDGAPISNEVLINDVGAAVV